MTMTEVKVKTRRILQLFIALILFRNFKTLSIMFRIKSTTNPIEAFFLYECARDGYGEGAIVEIGSFHGMSTIVMATGSKQRQREKVYAIDPLLDVNIRNCLMKNIKRERVEDYIIPCLMKSEEFSKDFKRPVRLIFIDGCHEYEEVRKDILLYKGYLIDGGIIALHDVNLESVCKAVNECIVNSDEFIVEGRVGYILFASKKISKNKALFCRIAHLNKIRSISKAILDKTWLKV